jgi:metal-responsive CopG/Arc/MetJ family transcriptional regulator
MRFNIMMTLSLALPDNLATSAQAAAGELGVSRTEFIRRAIQHELDRYEMEREQAEMAKSFKAMKKSKTYMEESDEIMSGLDMQLPKDKNEWWKKKS